MYITDANENVRKIFEELEKESDVTRMRFLLYVFDLINNDLINSKNEVNPLLNSDEELNIFNFESIGFESNFCTNFLQNNIMIYNNSLVKNNEAFEDRGSIIGIKYSEKDMSIITNFERLNFNEKLDVISELIIRYDNETYFYDKKILTKSGFEVNGFEIASAIKKMKMN